MSRQTNDGKQMTRSNEKHTLVRKEDTCTRVRRKPESTQLNGAAATTGCNRERERYWSKTSAWPPESELRRRAVSGGRAERQQVETELVALARVEAVDCAVNVAPDQCVDAEESFELLLLRSCRTALPRRRMEAASETARVLNFMAGATEIEKQYQAETLSTSWNACRPASESAGLGAVRSSTGPGRVAADDGEREIGAFESAGS
jgi:hypothetical protein